MFGIRRLGGESMLLLSCLTVSCAVVGDRRPLSNTLKAAAPDPVLSTQEVRRDPEHPAVRAYEKTGGAWVEGYPVFVNRDYAIDRVLADLKYNSNDNGAEPIVLANERVQANQIRAAGIAELRLRDVHLPSAVDSPASSERFAFYGVLFGDADPRMRAVMTVKSSVDGQSQRFSLVSEKRPFIGEGAWTSSSGEPIVQFLERAYGELFSYWKDTSGVVGEVSNSVLACALTDFEKIRGYALGAMENYILLQARDEANSRIICPKDAISSGDGVERTYTLGQASL